MSRVKAGPAVTLLILGRFGKDIKWQLVDLAAPEWLLPGSRKEAGAFR